MTSLLVYMDLSWADQKWGQLRMKTSAVLDGEGAQDFLKAKPAHWKGQLWVKTMLSIINKVSAGQKQGQQLKTWPNLGENKASSLVETRSAVGHNMVNLKTMSALEENKASSWLKVSQLLAKTKPALGQKSYRRSTLEHTWVQFWMKTRSSMVQNKASKGET